MKQASKSSVITPAKPAEDPEGASIPDCDMKEEDILPLTSSASKEGQLPVLKTNHSLPAVEK